MTRNEAGRSIIAQCPPIATSWRDWLGLIRVHQWLKNILILVPVVLSHSWNDGRVVRNGILAFFIFGLIASSTYILNDLADLEADRTHPTKRRRAMAAGIISTKAGAFVGALMLVLGLSLAASLSFPFLWTTLAYLAITVAYSFRLKCIPLMDLAVIAMLFTMRVVMGMIGLSLPSSIWLLSFSGLFFFSLAAAKRHAELMRALQSQSPLPARRGYRAGDEALTLACGISASFSATFVMLLYLHFEATQNGLYAQGTWLTAVPVVVLLWQFRVWLFSHRGMLHDDPVVFAIKDRISWLALGVIAVVFVMAI